MYQYQEKRKGIAGFLLLVLALITVAVVTFDRSGYGAVRFFVVILIGLALLVDIERIAYLYIFCFPFSSILKISETSVSILPFLCLIAIARLILSKQAGLTASQVVSLLVWMLIQLFCALAYNANLASILSLFLSVIFVLCLASYMSHQGINRQRVFQNAVVMYVAAVIACIVLSDLFPEMLFLISAEKQTLLVAADRFGATFVEPNEYAQVVLFAMGLLVSVYSSTTRTFWKAVIIGLIIYLGVSGYRSFSKSYALTLLGLLVVMILINLFKTTKEKGVGIMVLKLLPLSVVLFLGANVLYENVLLPTLEARDNTDFLTGRGDIWEWYVDALFQRLDVLFLGSGAGNATYLATVNYQIGNRVPHNIYLEFFVQYGIIGVTLFCLLISKIVKENVGKLSSYFALALCAFLITAFGISANSNDCLFVALLFLAIPIHTGQEPKIAQFNRGRK